MKHLPSLSWTGLLAVVALTLPVSAANWPGWRGPDGTGISPDKNLPLKWSTNENVRWRVPLPQRGNSSPIVWKDRVFVTQADANDRRTLMCFNRADGKLLWQSGVTYSEREQTQRDNPYCAATPVTDGERIIASFGSAGLYCYDFAGKELWHRDFGKMSHVFGNASSPVIHGDLCFFYFGPDEKARVIAVKKTSGETVYEIEPPKVEAEQADTRRGPGGPADAGGQGAGRGQGGGGRGGNFGVGATIAPQIFAQADSNKDQKLSQQELLALADLWIEKFGTDDSGKLSAELFANKFYDVIPSTEGSNDPNAAGTETRRRGPSRTTAPALFGAVDTDKDGSLTKHELKAIFTKWFGDWDTTQTGSVSAEKFREGLAAALPRGNQGGGGGGGRGPGGGGGGGGGRGGSWTTPLVIKSGGHDELIVNFPSRVAAYDPATGQQLWISKGMGGTIYSTPVWSDNVLVAMSAGPGGASAVAVKAGGKGDVSESQRIWHLERAKSGIGSGVVHEGHLYLISQDGIAQCLDFATGKTIWEERLKGPGSRSSSWSSILLAHGNLLIPNQSGDVFVVRASPKFEILSVNSVGEATNASLAASDGDLFLRTDKALWCFTAK